MDRYRVRASLNNHHLLSPPLHSSTKISLPPRPSITSYLPTHHTTNKEKEVDTTTELSIFDAERYFKESQLPTYTKVNTTTNSSTLINDDNNSSSSTVSSTWRDRSFRATPTASSEASWNSQSGLLIKPHSGSVFLSVRPKSFPFPLNEKIKSTRSRAPNTKSSSSSPSPSSFPASSRRFFSRNCSCYGRKSVAVAVEESDSKSPVRLTSAKATTQTESDHHRNLSVENVVAVEKLPVAKMKISPGTWSTESSTLFPTESERGPKKSLPPQQPHRILNSAVFSFQVLQPPPPPPSPGVDDPSRDSLEVFRPADELPNVRRLTDTQRRHVSFVGADADDDGESDASSELFEIESLSTQPAAYRRRDSLDELPKLTGSTAAGMLDFRRSLEETEASIAPSECYPPSEVSVQWSVTTAEGGSDRASLANFSSAASDVYDEIGFIQAAHDRFGATMIARSAGGGMKKVAGGLLSCRCENAVDVGPIPVKITPELRRPAVISVEPDRLQVISRFPLDKAEL